jgi:hypothetical protein
VTLVANKPEKDSVTVLFYDGKQKDFVYKSLVWGDVELAVPKKKEDDYIYGKI